VRLLDVACGPGFITAAAAARGADAIGLDFSSAMIARARQVHPSITFRDGDAQALPFDDGSFDAVVMNFGLLHLARPDVAIAEAARVLRPGGRYAFTIWAPPDKAVGFGLVLAAIERHGRTSVGLPEGPPFFRFSDDAECRRALQASGFTEIAARTLPLTWTVHDADDVFEAMTRGGVRTAAVLRAQTRAALDNIRLAIRESVEQYARGGGYEIPLPAMLAAGTKPIAV
jgi:SAM-dependent methyltransferase